MTNDPGSQLNSLDVTFCMIKYEPHSTNYVAQIGA